MAAGSQFCPAALGEDSCRWRAHNFGGRELSPQESIDELVETGPGNWNKETAERLLSAARKNTQGIHLFLDATTHLYKISCPSIFL